MCTFVWIYRHNLSPTWEESGLGPNEAHSPLPRLLMHECNCGISHIVLGIQLMKRVLLVNLLWIWRFTKVLQQYSQLWRLSLWFSSSLCIYTHSMEQTFAHSHGCLLPAIRRQIWVLVANIPQSAPLLFQTEMHFCMTTQDNTRGTTPTSRDTSHSHHLHGFLTKTD